MLDKNPQNFVSDLDRLSRGHDDAGVAREVLVAGDFAEGQTEIDARLHPVRGERLHSLKTNVVGVFQRADQTGAVEGDVEFPRQAIERTIAQNMMVHRAREGPGVDELPWIDARRRRAGDVANVVGAGAFAPQPSVLDAFDDLR